MSRKGDKDRSTMLPKAVQPVLRQIQEEKEHAEKERL